MIGIRFYERRKFANPLKWKGGRGTWAPSEVESCRGERDLEQDPEVSEFGGSLTFDRFDGAVLQNEQAQSYQSRSFVSEHFDFSYRLEKLQRPHP